MKVRKRDGLKEEFDSSKIKMSISNTSISANESLSQEELNSIVNDVVNTIKSRFTGEISNTKIREIVTEELKNRGFTTIATNYSNPGKFFKNFTL